MATYSDPAQRVVTNLLHRGKRKKHLLLWPRFGLVPWTVSCASYLLAFQLVDLWRHTSGEAVDTEAGSRESAVTLYI